MWAISARDNNLIGWAGLQKSPTDIHRLAVYNNDILRGRSSSAREYTQQFFRPDIRLSTYCTRSTHHSFRIWNSWRQPSHLFHRPDTTSPRVVLRVAHLPRLNYWFRWKLQTVKKPISKKYCISWDLPLFWRATWKLIFSDRVGLWCLLLRKFFYIVIKKIISEKPWVFCCLE